ncbi:MAG: FtsX-like permease family protein [Candidatus Binatus sp.]|uniref:ABC transporter permease n=1 Tax=Candidatus Binatus sp. TaxID=2811406 RepID=UPI0027251D3C|nr:ABC transporter permease [Candidatus Binatus sp.]MDO8432546.1 FtsX-like permease family protein [Candidatus Binatus sp.]
MIPIRYNLRSVVQRRATSLMTILGVALVAMIFVILFGFIGGLQRTLLNAGGAENWIVTRRAAPDETSSYISHEQMEILRVRPEIAQSSTGAALMSPEIFAGVNISPNKRVKEFALLRGVAPIAYQVHRNMRLVEGRWPKRGDGEWVIGQKLRARNPTLAAGTNFHFGRRTWNIVGTFADNDSARESEIWTDGEDLRVNFQNRDQGANSIHVVLKPASSDSFQQALKSDGRMPLDAITETDYYAAQSKVANQLRSLGLIVALALAIGAIFGGMNTMYTAVARRQREIGVLRAVGFTRRDILGSFVIESAILGIAGGVVGSVLAIIVARATGLNSRLMNVGITYFSYHASAGAIFAGMIAAIAIGVVGGLMPAWRAARIGVIESLRGV